MMNMINNNELQNAIATAAQSCGWSVSFEESENTMLASFQYKGSLDSSLEGIQFQAQGETYDEIVPNAMTMLLFFDYNKYVSEEMHRESNLYPVWRTSAGRRYLRRKIYRQADEIEQKSRSLADALKKIAC